MSDHVEYWSELAREDFATANVLLKSGRYLHCGYFCHQTVEKALKALIAKNCTELQFPPKTHDLVRLAELSGYADKEHGFSSDGWDLLKLLNPLQIEARYPSYKEALKQQLTKKFCSSILNRTEAFLEWSIQKL